MGYQKTLNELVKARVSKVEVKKIHELCESLNLDESKVIRLAINNLFEEVSNVDYDSVCLKINTNDEIKDFYWKIILSKIGTYCKKPLFYKVSFYADCLEDFCKRNSYIVNTYTPEKIAKEWDKCYIVHEVNQIISEKIHEYKDKNIYLSIEDIETLRRDLLAKGYSKL